MMPSRFRGPGVVMVDLDGTLADNVARYNQFFPPDVEHDWSDENWQAYDRACVTDPPIPYMVEVVRTLEKSYDIHLVTGRNDVALPETEAWGLELDLPYDELWMRETGDRTSNPELKVRVWKQLVEDSREVVLVIDDHPKVVDLFHNLGVRTLQPRNPTAPEWTNKSGHG